jgi:sulfur carrier protein
MTITINGRSRALPDGTRLGALLELLAAPDRGTAAAVDGEVVPRTAWSDFELRDGQAIELLTALQGG